MNSIEFFSNHDHVLPMNLQATHESTTQALKNEISELRTRLKDVDALGNQSNDTGSKVFHSGPRLHVVLPDNKNIQAGI